MKAYCLDTSGLSTPLEHMPEDIHSILWSRVEGIIKDGKFAVTTEIYVELARLPGNIGACIGDHKAELQLEIEEEDWDWPTYLAHVERMREAYKDVISEYNGNRKKTLGLTDLSIIALAKTLGLPVISSEKRVTAAQESNRRKKISDICVAESVDHIDSNEFLRAEGIKN